MTAAPIGERVCTVSRSTPLGAALRPEPGGKVFALRFANGRSDNATPVCFSRQHPGISAALYTSPAYRAPRPSGRRREDMNTGRSFGG